MAPYRLVKQEITVEELAQLILKNLQEEGDGITRENLIEWMIGEPGEEGVVFSDEERDQAVARLISVGTLQEVHDPQPGLPNWMVLRLVT